MSGINNISGEGEGMSWSIIIFVGLDFIRVGRSLAVFWWSFRGIMQA